jgi:hypothetical protein
MYLSNDGLIAPVNVPRIAEEWIPSTDGMTIDRIKPKYTERNLSIVTLSPLIPHLCSWDRTWASAVRNRQYINIYKYTITFEKAQDITVRIQMSQSFTNLSEKGSNSKEQGSFVCTVYFISHIVTQLSLLNEQNITPITHWGAYNSFASKPVFATI